MLLCSFFWLQLHLLFFLFLSVVHVLDEPLLLFFFFLPLVLFQPPPLAFLPFLAVLHLLFSVLLLPLLSFSYLLPMLSLPSVFFPAFLLALLPFFFSHLLVAALSLPVLVVYELLSPPFVLFLAVVFPLASSLLPSWPV